MNLKIKKLIAKEVLVLTSIGLFLLLMFLIIFAYNSYQKKASTATYLQKRAKRMLFDSLQALPLPLKEGSLILKSDLPVFDNAKILERKSMKEKLLEEISVLNKSQQLSISKIIEAPRVLKNTLIALLIIFFPLRLLFQLVKWSIRTLRLKE